MAKLWDSLEIRNFKLNPDFYLHAAIMEVIEAGKYEPERSLKDAMVAKTIALDTLENVAIGLKIVTLNANDGGPSDYTQAINEFIEGPRYKSEPDTIMQKVYLSNFKFRLIVAAMKGFEAIDVRFTPNKTVKEEKLIQEELSEEFLDDDEG